MRRVEHAREERERHNQKVLKCSKLIELFGPNAGDQTERAENRRAENRERDDVKRRGEADRHEPDRYDEHAEADRKAPRHGSEHIRAEHLVVRQRRQQHEHQVAGDLRLDQRGRAIRKGVLQHAHHHETGNQEARVFDARIDLHVTAQRVAENRQIQQRGDDRRQHGLERHLPETQDFLVKQRAETTITAHASPSITSGPFIT
jgi:hypothetical protein